MSTTSNPRRALEEFAIAYARASHLTERDVAIVEFTDTFAVLPRAEYDFDIDAVAQWQRDIHEAAATVRSIADDLEKVGNTRAARRLRDALDSKFGAAS
ncbi:hypothetical protein SEA_MORGANA_105 [Gordonia phage Morgana]|uniref:Uncharacterized protein n=1 Tax=Gordonia phage Morgana TaxID=3137292 RepID=A0AAX4RBV3_9CAUD